MHLAVVVGNVVSETILDIQTDNVAGDVGPLHVNVHFHLVRVVLSLKFQGR